MGSEMCIRDSIKAEPVELPPVTMEKSDDFMTFRHRGRALNPPGKLS